MTGDYPPTPGGVADYTSLLAQELARRGEPCAVWTRGERGSERRGGVEINGVGASWDADALGRLRDGLLRTPSEARIVVQYVPHLYGRRAMNYPFVKTIDAIAHRRPVEVMFHEVAFPWVRKPLRHNVLAAVNRLMARRLCRNASVANVSIPEWVALLRPLAPARLPIEWSPVPSNIPRATQESGQQLRAELGIDSQAPVVGHFGTYGENIGRMLAPALAVIGDRHATASVLLLGRGSEAWLASRRAAPWARRAIATGQLSADRAASALQACTVMIQPYHDGVSTRRGTMMACLANARPAVTAVGRHSEPFWLGCGAVAAASDNTPETLAELVCALLDDQTSRDALSARADNLYRSYFAIDRVVDRLLGLADPPSPERL